jgi:ABC-type polysaccharide/polyol phosphate transport system ATPase subunit
MSYQNSNGSVIEFSDVAVRYRIPRERVSGIKEFAIRWMQRRIVYLDFWALDQISFQVHQGETFGVIGRNGAGKSTLLKVMAQVLFPTRGRVVMRGKLAPLLELGGGFHPELTGRENVFLNMALLGHARRETEQLFESIVDFSEIRDFIDAPLRTYSTGMVTRLGFSVATCSRPDILLVDEALSVGDISFQEKCMNRMRAFSSDGTTIIIVSHSLASIENFCQRALWLDRGRIRALGEVGDVIQQYQQMDTAA